MGSASLQTKSACKRAFPSSRRNWGAPLAVGAVITLMLLLSRGELRWSHPALAATAVVGVVLLGALWHVHLMWVASDWPWLAALPQIVAGQLAFMVVRTRPESTQEWIGALGSGIFVYLMLWTFAAYEQEESLQPLATGALLLSGGILTKPAVAVSCVLLSLGFFFLRRRRHAAGALGFALLLFTPAVLCTISLAILSTVAGRAFGGRLADLLALRFHAGTPAHAVDPTLTACLLSAVVFSLAATLTRLVEGTSRAIDRAFGALLLFLILVGREHWMPVPLNAADIAMVAYGGGSILLALAPPRSWSCRLLVSLGGCVPLFFLLDRHS